MSSDDHERAKEIADQAMATVLAKRRGQSVNKYAASFIDRSEISPTGGVVSSEEAIKRRQSLNRTFKERFFGTLNSVIKPDDGSFTQSRPFIATMLVGSGRPSPGQSQDKINEAMMNFTRVREYIRSVDRDENGEIVRDVNGRVILYENLEFDQAPVQIFVFKKEMPGTDYSVYVRHLVNDHDTDTVMIHPIHTSSLQDIRRVIEQFVLTQVDENGNRERLLILGFYFTFFPSYSGKGGGLDPSEERERLEKSAAYNVKAELSAEIRSIPSGTQRQVVLLPNTQEEDDMTERMT
jgi:hypothetical protein